MTPSSYGEAMSSSTIATGISGRGYYSSGYLLDGYLCGECGTKRDGDWTLPCPICSNTSICTKCGATGECRHSSPSLTWSTTAIPLYRQTKGKRTLGFVTKPVPKFVRPTNRMTAKDRVKSTQSLKPNYSYLKSAFHHVGPPAPAPGVTMLESCLVCGEFDTVEKENGMCPVCVTAATEATVTELKVEEEDWLDVLDGVDRLSTGRKIYPTPCKCCKKALKTHYPGLTTLLCDACIAKIDKPYRVKCSKCKTEINSFYSSNNLLCWDCLMSI